MIGTVSFTREMGRSSDAVEALLAASARLSAEPLESGVLRRETSAWTLGFVDAVRLRAAELAEHTARIREFAERHQLTLIATHVDLPHENGLGFRALLASIERNPPQRVLVSRLAHLNSPVVLDGRPTEETKLECLTRLQVEVREAFP